MADFSGRDSAAITTTRRAVLRSLVVGLGGTLVAACSAPAPAAPTPARPTAAPAVAESNPLGNPTPHPQGTLATPGSLAAAAPNGTFNVGISSLGTTQTWLPWLEPGREGWAVLNPIYEGLVGVEAETGNLIPMLAERWEIEDGGRRWRFFLRKGVQFHNGLGELTAEDVRFTVDAYTGSSGVAASTANFNQSLERLDVPNPYEVVFVLKSPMVGWLYPVSQGQFGVACKRYVESVGEAQAAEQPVGTGPFRLVQFQRNQLASLDALDQHWRTTSHFKTVNLRQVPDDAARLATLRAGGVDIASLPYKLKREAESAGVTLLPIKGAVVYHVQLGGQILPSRDTFDPSVPWVPRAGDPASEERALKVRKAMNLAVDKQAILNAVFEGQGALAAVPFFVPGSDFVPADLQPYPFDAGEARRLLAEAGFGQGFSREVEMLVMPWPGRAEMADVDEVVAGFWEKNLGLTVKRTPMDFATWVPQVGRPRKMAWVTWAHGFNPRPVAEPILSMTSWLTSKASYNTIAETAEIDALAEKINAEIDRAKRTTLYQELARLFYDQYSAVPIGSVAALYAYNPKKLASWPLIPGDAYLSGYELATPPA